MRSPPFDVTQSRRQPAPFKVGQEVFYTPSQRGHHLEAIFDGRARLEPGRRYRVAEIQEELYVVVEGYEHEHPGGGLYWIEFSRVHEIGHR